MPGQVEGSRMARSSIVRKFLEEALDLGKAAGLALVIWQSLIYVTGSPTPVMVVLTGSMEPGIRAGDVLVVRAVDERPVRAGDIVVFRLEGREIPIVHRVVRVHEDRLTGEVELLTKGDANPYDDLIIYGPDLEWIRREHLVGRVVCFVPYLGKITVLLRNKSAKFIATAALGFTMLLLGFRERFNDR
ncbi:signal peptidase I [Marchantia polymorpha subsp. ruderalis]|uniref:Signal peptidase complex catalytic subunit SEC11 n=2 Tax=Marchantia polymorpha TaxID=3197 RepID=A0AAF6BDT7_MARPO|nr:hypothetical protein MARPO_0175s0013 [Marchantia polymorpha]BBN10171.1 hypothetical protein Mp_5g01510 [Marchantia polymorpha subsp. ruderalis]|eukprot:PTQ28051.1 hypothetical protein MARPO_0175s0013 [Marchantia polymorpha]